ncbi:MAG TPA: glycosyltransferase [Anaerolineales bacterium]|nr:glycosyltransferase [Anaerolineales bacterium]
MRVLYLSTWFPYPPDQGSKIRAFHLLKALAQRHDVALVSFEDAPVQESWRRTVEDLCASVEVVQRKPFGEGRGSGWTGWLSIRPRAVLDSTSKEMQAAVEATARRWRPDAVVAMTFVTAPYARRLDVARRVVDVDNLLAEMLREEIALSAPGLGRVRRYLAYLKFRNYERWLYRPFDLCLVTSDGDARRIGKTIPLRPAQIGVVPNGVDVKFYRRNGAASEEGKMIFTGALTYEPNLDAMQFFVKRIFPHIHASMPEAHLAITGRTDGVPLESLGANSRVKFTGYVEDIRPMVSSSAVCVVPLRKGAGTRLKILEAMALGTPVVSTTKGAEGLAVESEKHVLIADEPEAFARQTLRLLGDSDLRRRLIANAAELVRERYDWADIGSRFVHMLESLDGVSPRDR